MRTVFTSATSKLAVASAFTALCLVNSCSSPRSTNQDPMKEGTSNGYTYRYLPNDPLKTRIYTLSNGLEVYLSDYKARPRIFTQIVVRAGSKFDPPTHTGLAHYLEHMLFKGTERLGTSNWEKERPLLDSIEHLFEVYATITDSSARRSHYAEIDKRSNQAASYAISNEYDALLSAIGATATNAYTSDERTVYINNIPSNQLSTWLQIEAERFQHLAPRLFHTELETVYEEKNRTLDRDIYVAYELLFKHLYPNHPYGTQTTIGSIDHLKNPSIRAIKKYFQTYYRPNNVAICLSGDLDYDQTIALIDNHFGAWKQNDSLPTWTSPRVEPPSRPIEQEVQGPEAEFVIMAYLMGGQAEEAYKKLFLVDRLLNNSQAGLIDLNLVQEQRILSCGTYVNDGIDYSSQILYAHPREGQSLEEVRDLILGQITELKNGNFEDELIEAVINDYKKELLSDLEDNRERSNMLVEVAANPSLSLAQKMRFVDDLRRITKEEIIQFAQDYYQNYVLVYKRKGERVPPQVEKPEITKVSVNSERTSAFAAELLALEPKVVKPRFLDYDRDIQLLEAKDGELPVYYLENSENDRFSLYYYSDLSTRHDPKLSVALRYLDYIAPEGMSPASFQRKLFGLGAMLSSSINEHRSFIKVSGLSEYAGEAIRLVEQLLARPQPHTEALSKLIKGILKERKNATQDRNTIRRALLSYSLYGADSPFTYRLSNEELLDLAPEELLLQIRSFNQYRHRILYYGPLPADEVVGMLDEHHQMPDSLSTLSEPRSFEVQTRSTAQVYWTDYPMVQAEILISAATDRYHPDREPLLALYNEIFGAGMSSIIFKQLREAQGLAYSTYATYQTAQRNGAYDTFSAYIGTQADKHPEATSALLNLTRNFPATEQGFEIAQDALLNRIRNQRILREAILLNYEVARRKGLDYDIRKRVFEEAKSSSLDDIRSFHATQIKDRPFVVSILGDATRLNLDALKEYGPVQQLSTEELFGYGVPVSF